MNKKYALIRCWEREISLIGTYNDLNEARKVMHKEVVKAMQTHISDENDINNFRTTLEKEFLNIKHLEHKSEFYVNESDICVSYKLAWANLRGDNYDWKIIDLEQDIEQE
jgi:hypothetical protein